MIERSRYGFDGEITFCCDGCDTELHTEIAEFNSALAFMRREGWTPKREAGDWSHYCPDCAE